MADEEPTLDVVLVGFRPGEETDRALSDVRELSELGISLHYFDNTGNPKNLSMAWNDLAMEGRARYIAFLNSDLILSPGWDAKLVMVLDQRPDVGAAIPFAVASGPVTYHGNAFTIGSPPSREDMASLALHAQEIEEPEIYDYGTEGAPFFAVMVRRSDFESLRGFDERFRFYAQDHEFQERLRSRGQKTVRVSDCPAWHGGSIATKRASEFNDMSPHDEYVFFGEVLSRVRRGDVPRWHDLDDPARVAVRADRRYYIPRRG